MLAAFVMVCARVSACRPAAVVHGDHLSALAHSIRSFARALVALPSTRFPLSRP